MSIYLDNNATTALDDRVLEAMLPYLRGLGGNPSSMHQFGRRARAAIDVAREQVAALVGVSAKEIIFTSGGTEANNLAIRGVASRFANFRFACLPVEHPCVLEPGLAADAQRQLLPVDSDGVLLLEEAAAALAESEANLASVMLANNETGVLQPVAEFSAIAQNKGALLHCDAVQAAGKMAVNMPALGVDLMTLSSHKIYGPKGMGALCVKNGVDIAPLLAGGGQEDGLRSGTENLAAIVGFGKAAELAAAEWPERAEHCLQLRQHCEQGLKQMSAVTIFAEKRQRLSNTLMFSFAGIDGETLLMQLDQQGVAVASGSACHSAEPEPSHVLMAMGVGFEAARSAIRVSIGKDNTDADVDSFLAALRAVAQRFGVAI